MRVSAAPRGETTRVGRADGGGEVEALCVAMSGRDGPVEKQRAQQKRRAGACRSQTPAVNRFASEASNAWGARGAASVATYQESKYADEEGPAVGPSPVLRPLATM